MMHAEVKLAPLALPILTATTSAHTRDGLLVVDGHGFSLRLGRVARAGFGTAALGPRGVVPPDVGGLTTALAGLARSSDGELSGCAALDRALCTAVGRASGCIAAACPAGLAALTARLEGVFDAADGTGLDLYLSGSAPLVDARGVGYVRQFGSLIADPNAIATWSVDLRTASGSSHQITSFNGVRATSP
jgi:hypothetical protein